MMTLKKISIQTGFSVSTVSKALNDKDDINPSTKKIIQDFASKSNYKQNKTALALRLRKSFIVAIIMPRINNSLYGEILHDIQKCAAKNGYRIMFFQSFEEMITIHHYLEEVADRTVDAAILLTVHDKIKKEVESNYINLPVKTILVNQDQSASSIKETCAELFKNF
jgi:DNA-binding LacI/PurR family transcriptional regulator